MLIGGGKIEDYMLPCLNKKYLGFECMGCGLQRSAAHLLRGEFVEAFYMYPAIYTLILLFLAVFISIFKSYKYSNKIIISLAILNVVVIITSFIIKNYIN